MYKGTPPPLAALLEVLRALIAKAEAAAAFFEDPGDKDTRRHKIQIDRSTKVSLEAVSSAVRNTSSPQHAAPGSRRRAVTRTCRGPLRIETLVITQCPEHMRRWCCSAFRRSPPLTATPRRALSMDELQSALEAGYSH